MREGGILKLITLITVVAGIVLPTAFSSAAQAQEPVVKGTPSSLTVLRGEWTFRSSFTHRHYSGDVEIRLGPADVAGVYHGKVSYDGQQTNDRCSTKSGFSSDEPVDAQVTREGNNLRVKFVLKCPIDPSPRPFEWTLTGGSDGVFTQEIQNNNGAGLISVKQVK